MEEKNVVLELRKMANIMKRTFDNILENKITTTQSLILNYIYDSNNFGKIVYQKDIEEFFSIRRSTVCEILNIMEKNKLIKRNPSKIDLRIKEIKLEINGMKFINEFKNVTQKLENVLEKDVSLEELKIFFLVLEKFKKNLEDIC